MEQSWPWEETHLTLRGRDVTKAVEREAPDSSCAGPHPTLAQLWAEDIPAASDFSLEEQRRGPARPVSRGQLTSPGKAICGDQTPTTQ